MKFKKIAARMLVLILPIVTIAMVVLTVISGNRGKSAINEQMEDYMVAELNSNNSQISSKLVRVYTITNEAADILAYGYKEESIANMESYLKDMVLKDDIIYGCGIWFEPFEYHENQEYVGPYAYRDDEGNACITYDYSNAEYDYLSQEYYTMSINNHNMTYTNPFYDATSGIIMVSVSSPMYSTDGRFIGCVSADVSLGAIKDVVDEIKIGKKGNALLVSAEGLYLGGVDSSVLEDGGAITSESNSSLADAGKTILSKESGITSYKDDGETYNLYYATVPDVGWKLIIRVPQSQTHAPITNLVKTLVIVCVIAIIISGLAIILQVKNISKALVKVKVFAETLANGDFTIQPIEMNRVDELGQLGDALNTMYASNKELLQKISSHADEIHVSSKGLNTASDELLAKFENIETMMNHVNDAMMSASAATEQVNASSEEVSSSVNILAGETIKSHDMSTDIKGRATNVESDSRQAYQYATDLAVKYESNLKRSIENAAVVESIGELANVISGIAGQINLLSLNASIEAARAGEQGKGFAVVATEIGKLAGETANAVGEIQETIEQVNTAFNLLAADSESLVKFVQETVTPDYNKFVNVAKQYGTDADSIEGISTQISEMAGNIESIMAEVASAVQGIAENTQDTADNSGNIMTTIEAVSQVVNAVFKMSQKQKKIANDLNEVVSKFKL